jgi:hypothetical protein
MPYIPMSYIVPRPPEPIYVGKRSFKEYVKVRLIELPYLNIDGSQYLPYGSFLPLPLIAKTQICNLEFNIPTNLETCQPYHVTFR